MVEDLVKRMEELMNRSPPPEPQPLDSEPCDYADDYLDRLWDISIGISELNKYMRLLVLLQALQVLAIFLYLVSRWLR